MGEIILKICQNFIGVRFPFSQWNDVEEEAASVILWRNIEPHHEFINVLPLGVWSARTVRRTSRAWWLPVESYCYHSRTLFFLPPWTHLEIFHAIPFGIINMWLEIIFCWLSNAMDFFVWKGLSRIFESVLHYYTIFFSSKFAKTFKKAVKSISCVGKNLKATIDVTVNNNLANKLQICLGGEINKDSFIFNQNSIVSFKVLLRHWNISIQTF